MECQTNTSRDWKVRRTCPGVRVTGAGTSLTITLITDRELGNLSSCKNAANRQWEDGLGPWEVVFVVDAEQRQRQQDKHHNQVDNSLRHSARVRGKSARGPWTLRDQDLRDEICIRQVVCEYRCSQNVWFDSLLLHGMHWIRGSLGRAEVMAVPRSAFYGLARWKYPH
jgi:hypothetical protein